MCVCVTYVMRTLVAACLQVLYSYSIGFLYILVGQIVTTQLWEAVAFCFKVGVILVKFYGTMAFLNCFLSSVIFIVVSDCFN